MTNFAFITAQTEQMSTGEAITSLVISLIVSIPAIIALWKVYTKAGEPGWKILIPIYDLYTLCKIADGNGWKFLLFLIPFVNIVYAIILNIRLAKSFGKGVGFGIGLIFLEYIFIMILGFGSAQYIGPRGNVKA